jgi:hypothetical protein
MFSKTLFFALTALALVTMACGFTVNIPVNEFKAGPTRTTEIFVESPDASMADVRLEFGAGQLDVSPGAGDALISGEATYNLDELEPVIDVDDERVRVSTGDRDFTGIPRLGDDLENSWDLELGDMPMDLVINAGAYQGEYELGGLSLNSLDVADGAADVRMRFSEPNQVEMESLRYITGASNVRLIGLANANFSSMVFRGGAGDYVLDFSGELQRDAVVTIESGISRVVLRVPENSNAVVRFKGGLSSVQVSGDWQSSGSQYSVEGEGPQLIINVDLGAGSLELETD